MEIVALVVSILAFLLSVYVVDRQRKNEGRTQELEWQAAYAANTDAVSELMKLTTRLYDSWRGEGEPPTLSKALHESPWPVPECDDSASAARFADWIYNHLRKQRPDRFESVDTARRTVKQYLIRWGFDLRTVPKEAPAIFDELHSPRRDVYQLVGYMDRGASERAGHGWNPAAENDFTRALRRAARLERRD